jgi:toxin ParE1/3/4
VTYTLHPEAEAELMEVATYLAEHASRKVAGAYLDEFERVAGMVELFPGIGTPEEDGYRVYPFAKFKYSLVYCEDVHGLLILAVAPHLREPGYWKSRGLRS